VYGESEGTGKETAVAYVKVISPHSPRRTHPRFELGTLRIQVRPVATIPKRSVLIMNVTLCFITLKVHESGINWLHK